MTSIKGTDDNKKLSDRFNKLAREIADTFLSMSELRQKAHEIIEVGTQLGMNHRQIKEVVLGLTKGRVSERTVSNYLGNVGKDQYMKALADRSHARRKFSADDLTNNNNKEINLSVRHETREAEIIQEPKPVIHETSTEIEQESEPVWLDCNKFRTDLRTGLLNSAKLKLLVKDNEVVKII